MNYCQPNQPITDVWIGGAFNQCFIDTFASIFIGLLMGGCAIAECVIYRRHGTRLDRNLLGATPLLFILQLSLNTMLFIIQPIRLIVRSLKSPLVGSMIVKDTVLAIVWIISAVLVVVERCFDLPTQPSARHSIYLILFWGMALVVDSFYLINMGGEYWYFRMKSGVDAALLLLFVTQWLAELMVFVLGIMAPGMISNLQRNQYIYRPMSETPRSGKYGATSGSRDTIVDVDDDDENGESSSNSDHGLYDIDEIRKQLINGQLVARFQRLHRQSAHASVVIAQSKKNERLNRYSNVLPYDHNRVILAGSSNDYINASYITMQFNDDGVERRYIATQGPKSTTIVDFWSMVWEQGVSTIVMLTDLFENGVAKCDRYWPSLQDESRHYGSLIITCAHLEVSKTSTFRELFVINEICGDQRTVNHVQLHGWPDHGTPKDARKLIDFWKRIQSIDNDVGRMHNSPLLVHCSAGIGRTGAYILMETLINAFESNTPIDPVQVVQMLRDQRMAMVQTEHQMIFAVQAAIEYVLNR